MKTFEEWFGTNWPELLAEWVRSRSRLVFDAYCEMRYVNRREIEWYPMSLKMRETFPLPIFQ